MKKHKGGITVAFKERLEQLRKKNGWTKTEAAKKMGVTVGAYANWEYGNREPDQETLMKISSVFGISTVYLLEGKLLFSDTIKLSTYDENESLISNEELKKMLNSSDGQEALKKIANMPISNDPLEKVFKGFDDKVKFYLLSILDNRTVLSEKDWYLLYFTINLINNLDNDDFKLNMGVIFKEISEITSSDMPSEYINSQIDSMIKVVTKSLEQLKTKEKD